MKSLGKSEERPPDLPLPRRTPYRRATVAVHKEGCREHGRVECEGRGKVGRRGEGGEGVGMGEATKPPTSLTSN